MKGKENNLDDKPLIYVPPKKRTFFFVLLYCLFMIDFISRVGINAIFPIIQGDLGLTDTEVGLMGSVVLLGMGALVLPISFLGEKYSPKKAISISALIWSIGTFFSGMAGSFNLLIASRFLVGTGNAAYAPLSNSILTSMYCKSVWGKRIGLYNTAMTVGSALGAIVFANLANTFGWRMAFYTVGIISLILTVASLSLPDPKKVLDQQKKESNEKASKKTKVGLKEALQVTLKNKALIGVCLGGGVASIVVQGTSSWLSIYFVREMNISIGIAATFISIKSLLAALGYPIGGTIMDKWYKYDKRCRVYWPAISLTIAVVSYGIGFYFKIVPLIFFGAIFITAAVTCYHVATQELVPSWFKSVSYGVFVLSVQLLGATGPILIGVLSEAFGLINALTIVQILLVVAVVIFLLTSRVYIKDFNKARNMEKEAGV